MNNIPDITKRFYIRVAEHFDITRQYSWGGWTKLFKYFIGTDFYPHSFLDLGCGNGRFIESIKANQNDFLYLGIDNNRYLITKAKGKYASPRSQFCLDDFVSNWPTQKKFDLIVLFGVFHHINSYSSRVALLKEIRRHLDINGKAVLTVWNFKKLNLYKKKLTRLEIELLDLDMGKLNKNDAFLKWSDDINAIRYCHYYTKKEILMLLKSANLRIEKTFKADGTDGNTNTYYIISPS